MTAMTIKEENQELKVISEWLRRNTSLTFKKDGNFLPKRLRYLARTVYVTDPWLDGKKSGGTLVVTMPFVLE